MLKVLIVDDEESICRLIEYLVPWEELDMEVIQMVHNGNEAIQILSQQKVDILISDARMPGCDGIELIKWCRTNDIDVHCIIISGFKHFEYAHGAMKYGAVNYLLKPIKQEELVDTLQRIKDTITSRQSFEENKVNMQKVIDLNKDNLKRHFINSYVFDGNKFVHTPNVKENVINEQYHLNFQKGVYQTVFFKLDNISKEDKEIEDLITRIEDKIETAMKQFCTEYAGTRTHTGIFYLVNYSVEKQDEFIPFLQKVYENLEKEVYVFDQLRLTIGVSNKQLDIKYISDCIFSAGCAIKYRIRNLDMHVIEYDQFRYSDVNIDSIITAEIEEMIKSSLQTCNKEALHRCVLKSKLDILSIPNYSPVSLYDYASRFGIIVKKTIEKMLESEWDGGVEYRRFNQEIDYAMSEDDIWKAIEKFTHSSIDYILLAMKNIATRPLRIAMDYISKHYMEQITLETVAEAVMLSPNYLSKVFKNETGTNFSDYIISKRMEKAADLLRMTDLAIAQIAEEVGYVDVKYFRKLCKKYMGLKPSEYRKLYS